jgi:hypothetical protein
MGKQFKVIVNNKLSKDGFLKKVAMATGNDAEKIAKAGEVADACADITDEDRCEAAFKIGKCVKEESEKRGLNVK